MVKVSFVVPVYNVEKYVAQCIESLCQQDEKNVEIILVDDGSTDNSLAICKEWEKKDKRVIVLHQANQGANAARNAGLLRATGKWVCFVDGDDWVERNICTGIGMYLEKLYDIIFFSYNKVAGEKKKAAPHIEEKIEFGKKDFYDLQIATFNRLGPYKYNAKVLDAVSVWNKMYRRSFLIENELFFVPGMPKLQDLTFNITVYDFANSGVYINIPSYNYRINSESVSHRYQEHIAKKFEIINGYLKSFVASRNDEKLMQAYYERIATHLRTCVVLCYCNKKNEKSYTERKSEFLYLLDEEPYVTAVQEANVQHYTIKESVLSWAIKHRLFVLCEGLCKVNGLLRN